jgi:dTDP-4-amino-4,6-dideoxygalactose transaminase
LTNNGPLVGELESRLKEYLGLPYLSYLGNGTIALQLAIKALELKGEIITTPFSYVATTSAIVWEGCMPVFVDIDPETFNIDPTKIEASITPNTSAILATHCFGNPCGVEAIDSIAKKHNLKVIYDAAHCFGTLYKGQTIFSWGDISTTSFHATKLFHTIEGGAIFAKDEELNKKIAWMRNFGHHGPEKFYGVGINGKNSEVHAAMGLVNLKHIEEILGARKRQSFIYDSYLGSTSLRKPKIYDSTSFNFAYYPVVFNFAEEMLRVKTALEEHGIYPRRYFYPSLSSLNYIKNVPTPISDDIASKILCLPIYHDLLESDQQRVCNIILRNLEI